MTGLTSTEAKSTPASKLRCIGCGTVWQKPERNFRCTGCGDLWEIVYPGWNTRDATQMDAAALRSLWRKRRTSGLPADESGVWRFREMLPSFGDWQDIVTLREGNTGLYEMPGCAR